MNQVPKTHNQAPWVDARLLDNVLYMSIGNLKPYPGNPRKHPKRQQKKLDASVRAFGLVVPILVDANNEIVAGEALWESARRLEYSDVPVLRVDHLSEAEIKALRIALNRIADLAEWDEEKLVIELQNLLELDFDLDLTGFETPEIDLIFEEAGGVGSDNPADDVPNIADVTVSCLGDKWLLDQHRILCGDARDPAAFEALLEDDLAQMVFTDAPYNVKIEGNVGGKGKIKHPEFVMASGEMTDAEYEAFLADYVQNLTRFSVDGSVHFHCMDWRHISELELVCRQYYSEHLNTCVWAKTNAGMGSFYRSQHEFVLVMKSGAAGYINNIQLGRFGRNRSNLWTYAGCNSPTKDRRADLKMHPTVKPSELVAGAIRDGSKRGGLILDPFLGSGTTIIACELTGRIGAGLELDPKYVDVTIRRWETYTGGGAVHAETGLTFAEMRELRSGNQLLLPPPGKSEEA